MCSTAVSNGRGKSLDDVIQRQLVFICEVCHKPFNVVSSDHRLRRGGMIRFCSRPCNGAHRRKEGTHIEVTCAQCGVTFTKRRDHIKPLNYCSPACTHAARRVEGALWRDPEHIRAYMHDYVVNNREKHNERSRLWGAANRPKKLANLRARRGKGSVADFTAADWQAILERYGRKCAYCGATEYLQADHIIPIARGGPHTRTNIQPLCRSCNARKGAKLVPA